MREICTSGLTRGAANPPLLYNLGGPKANPRKRFEEGVCLGRNA
jgi:hypothetical protein